MRIIMIRPPQPASKNGRSQEVLLPSPNFGLKFLSSFFDLSPRTCILPEFRAAISFIFFCDLFAEFFIPPTPSIQGGIIEMVG